VKGLRRSSNPCFGLKRTAGPNLEERYPVEGDSEEDLIHRVSVTSRVGFLSIIGATGDKGGVLVGIDLHDESIAPSFELSRDLFVDVWNSQLLQIHPSTPTIAFEWKELTAAGTGIIYPARVRMFAGGSGTLPKRLSKMVDAAHVRASIVGMPSTERRELETLIRRVVAEEAARYLVSGVPAHRLPRLSDKNKEALRLVTERGALLFSLGHLYGFAWRAARDASSAPAQSRNDRRKSHHSWAPQIRDLHSSGA
jgi:hypothetical protein